MSAFLVVAREPDPQAGQAASDLRQAAGAHGLAVSDLSPLVWIGVAGPRPPARLTVGTWVLVGDVRHRERRVVDPATDEAPFSYERKLMARFWGRFVGIQILADGRASALLRDPSGALDCVAWTDGGVTIVASTALDWLIARLRPGWSVDFDRVHAALHDPLTVWGDLLLRGPTPVLPGAIQPLPLSEPSTQLWAPAEVARRGLARPRTDAQAGAELRLAIDDAVRGLSIAAGGHAAEVSGGLDSGVVAASLVHAGRGSSLWLNAYGDDPGSDERVYVSALAEHLDIAPVSVSRGTGLVTTADIEAISGDFRPGLNALDIHHDRDWAHRLEASGLRAVMTGKGGDSMFVEAATGDVFSDLWRDRGVRALLSPGLPRLAAWNGRSIWALVAQARGGAGAEPGRDMPGLLTPLAPEGRVSHPWLDDLDDFGPAKAHQIAGVVDGLGNHGFSLQHAAADVLHPLVAQPVIEACLGLPTWQLTLGRRDRALVREAFRDRLPPALYARRSKGEMTAYYGRMIADSLDVLRPWIIDGRLAREGLVDRVAADHILTRESLIWRGGYAGIMATAAMEGWVRIWEARLGPAR